MRRISAMTIGFVLIFVGIQLHLVETFVLTPRFSNFMSANAPQFETAPVATGMNPNFSNPNSNQANQPPAYDSPYYQASYQGNGQAMNQQSIQSLQPMMPRVSAPPRTVSPPKWICWPVLFLGTVVFLHGISMRRN